MVHCRRVLRLIKPWALVDVIGHCYCCESLIPTAGIMHGKSGVGVT